MENVQDLIKILDLERIEEQIFRGQSHFTPWGNVFGGQVLAQALRAGRETVPEDRLAHSLHAYFILPGDVRKPIVYEVENTRDGGSFTTRRITAIQKGRPIFVMAASFQLQQEGLEHQLPMPDVTPPEELKTDIEWAEPYKDIVPEIYYFFKMPRPIEFRPVEQPDLSDLKSTKPIRHVWMRSKGEISDDRLHREILAYASDYNLLATSLLPHQSTTPFRSVQMASLDHAMWFHREPKMDDWVLYALDSPSATNARGFNRGSVYNRQGQIIASVVQEGMIRKRR